MAGRKQTIEDRINKAEAVVIKAKEKYEAALEDLNLLVKKKKEMESKELMRAYEKKRAFTGRGSGIPWRSCR